MGSMLLKKVVHITWLHLLFPLLLTGQPNDLAILEKQLEHLGQDSSRVAALNQLSAKYLPYKPELAKNYADEALALAKEIKDKAGEIVALSKLAEYHWRQSNYALSVEITMQSLQLAEQQKDSAAMARGYRLLGIINTYGLKQYDRALLYEKQALAIYEQKKDYENMASLYGNITWIYGNTGEHLDLAKAMATRGVNLADSLGNDQLVSYNYNSLGLIAKQQNKWDSALYFLQQSNDWAQKINDHAVIAFNQTIIGNIHLENRNYNLAYKAFTEAETLSRSLNLRESLKDAYHGLSLTHQKNNNPTKAFEYLLRYTELKDSLVNWEITQKALMMEFELAEQKRQAKIIELEKATALATKEKNIYLALITIGAVASAVIIGLIMRNNRERRMVNLLLQEKNAQLLHANGIKNKLFSIIGHDLRSPLHSLKGLLSLASRSEISEKEFKQFTPQLSQHVISVNETVDNLFQWSASQMDGWKHEAVLFSTKAVVAKVFNLLSETANHKNIALINNCADDHMVTADQDQVELILRNLVHNGIKFTQEKGTVTVSSQVDKNFISISVTDTGVGMTSTQIEELFKKLDIRTTRGTKGERGTGLGLTLCQEMAQNNGGKILVQSEVGKSSTFLLLLPLMPNEKWKE